MTAWSERWADWLSYRPSDFLMFAPRTYWRLFELHNEAWWPLQVPALLLGVAGLAWLVRRDAGAAQRLQSAGARVGLLVLALAWVFVGWAFVLGRYAAINWAAQGLAALFMLQAVALVALAAQGSPSSPSSRSSPTDLGRRCAAALLGWAIFAQPLVAPLIGQPWLSAEVAGLAPDPTVMATLAWLLALAPAPAAPPLRLWSWRVAWAIALACAGASAATLATMDSPAAAAPAAAAIFAGWARRRQRAAAHLHLTSRRSLARRRPRA